MNIIEPTWVALHCAVQKRSPPPGTLMDLRTALQDSWCEKPPGYLQTLVDFMPRRIAALLCARVVRPVTEVKATQPHTITISSREAEHRFLFQAVSHPHAIDATKELSVPCLGILGQVKNS
ncbi:hypothetical protein AVEN_27450-1 [Araneus ventricosus]|uniref:Uncharacterized protein n=1 Tax=Araneus ventricosus TaxID=182803 RepID=A0A4Y2EFY0_ARAVE|nr:hypothetical protein AVEN_27450-1 [Araneus ventricosus]